MSIIGSDDGHFIEGQRDDSKAHEFDGWRIWTGTSAWEDSQEHISGSR